uniref:Uncharacterized protein n=1 Tax=Anguilla anguilla TaxID=7936 RepID=A0A0E9SV22_ANGAN
MFLCFNVEIILRRQLTVGIQYLLHHGNISTKK